MLPQPLAGTPFFTYAAYPIGNILTLLLGYLISATILSNLSLIHTTLGIENSAFLGMGPYFWSSLGPPHTPLGTLHAMQQPLNKPLLPFTYFNPH